ncbi:MAG: hypothetical protein OXU73_02630 [Candidatus Campbellbacteria bacterium]|nr:hypothetical protein [Candidatus Campbellbacteria bacterium]
MVRTKRRAGGILFSLILAILIVAYLLWNSRVFRAGPVINVESPVRGAEVVSPVVVEGDVSFTSEILLNGRAIFITPEMEFRERIAFPVGYNVINLKATSPDGRVRNEAIEIIVVE